MFELKFVSYSNLKFPFMYFTTFNRYNITKN